MKKVLITGASGFIGSYLKEHLTGYEISTLSLRDPNWRQQPIDADVVIHCAGLSHTRVEDKSAYMYVNFTLTKELYDLCLDNDVNQFIYLSSILVYSPKEGAISHDTIANPSNNYGYSKLMAEKYITDNLSNMIVSIIRLPLVLGDMPKGYLKIFFDFAKYSKLFFSTNNIRSIIRIEDLLNCIVGLIVHKQSGIIIHESLKLSTGNLFKLIRYEYFKKNTILIPLASIVTSSLRNLPFIGYKLFGDLYYEDSFLTWKEY